LSESLNFQDTWDYLRKYGEKSRWKFIELRDANFLPPEIQPSSTYYRHTLELSQNDDEVFKSFRGSTKRNIKKATKQGVEVRISNSIGAVKEFCRLNCLTRKKHGLPPQPFYFFNKVFDHIISKNQGFIVLAYYKKEIIAANVYFHFGEKAIYKYGASNTRHQQLRANNIVMWEAIKWYCQNGYRTFCFGRSEVDNQGLLQFKSGWGTEQKIIKYYKYNLHKKVFVDKKSTNSNTHQKIFRKMPIPLLKLIGSALYPHMG
jgi:lipid II:glycine glycyltransferase (peptidoglycan interpeptide bridge formation enzyme)